MASAACFYNLAPVSGRFRIGNAKDFVASVTVLAVRRFVVLFFQQLGSMYGATVLLELIERQVAGPHPARIGVTAGAEYRRFIGFRFSFEAFLFIHCNIGIGRVSAVAVVAKQFYLGMNGVLPIDHDLFQVVIEFYVAVDADIFRILRRN